MIYCTSADLFDRAFIKAGHGREGRAKRSEDVGGSRLQHPPSPEGFGAAIARALFRLSYRRQDLFIRWPTAIRNKIDGFSTTTGSDR